MKDMRNIHRILVGNPEGKIPLGRPRGVCDDITMDFRETVWEGMDHWRALVNTVMNLRGP
jgi:hypothetical protein